ncbi:MAG: hypothetical protein ACLSAH_22260 [Bilophila wadsworthia]
MKSCGSEHRRPRYVQELVMDLFDLAGLARGGLAYMLYALFKPERF